MHEVMQAVDPVLSSLLPNDTTWSSLKDGIQLGSYVTDLLAGNGKNMSAHDLMSSVATFLHDVDLALDGLSPDVRHMLDAFAHVDWMHLYDLLTHAAQNNLT
jgi:hypothetical protein